jgi:hypothetical protein
MTTKGRSFTGVLLQLPPRHDACVCAGGATPNTCTEYLSPSPTRVKLNVNCLNGLTPCFRAHFETCAFTTEHHSQKPCLYVVLNVLQLPVRRSDDNDDNHARSSSHHLSSLDSLADEGCGLKLRDGSGRM